MKTIPSTTQKILASLTLFTALAICATKVQAATIIKANTTTMNTAADWGGTAPVAADTGQFDSTISAADEVALTLGGNVSLTGFTFLATLNGPVIIGTSTGSTLTLGGTSGGATLFNLSAANQDVTVNCAVSVNNENGNIINVASGHSLIFGGSVAFNQSSGNSIEIDGPGQVVITNTGSFSYPGQNLGFYIGNGANPGNLVNYGTNSDLNGSSGGNMHLGHNSSGTSTFTMNGGVFSAHGNNGNPPMLIGDTSGGTGVLTINHGAFNNIGPSGGITLDVGDGGTGRLNLNGGLLGAYRITTAGGTGTAFFNGGTVRYINGSANTTFISGLSDAYISAGGLIVDGAYGQNFSIPQQLLADTVTPSSGGGLTVRGTNSLGNGAPLLPSGQVVLNPGSGLAETYTGPTIINDDGELNLTPTSLTTGVINSSSTLAFGSNYLGGGVLFVNGSGTSTQTFNGLNVWNGANGITNNLNGATASTIALGSITRPSAANGVVPGGTIDFQGISSTGLNGATRITGAPANNASGIIGGWATVSNATWAINDGSGNIVNLPDASYTTLPTSGGSSSVNYNFASGSNPTGSIVANSLRIQNGTLALGANTITLNGDTGGLMTSSGNSSTITSSGGCITVPSGQELIIDCGIAYGIGANSQLTATGNTIGGTSTGITVSKTGPSTWNLNPSGGAGPAFVGSLLIHQGTVSANISSWGATNVMIDAGARILLNSASLTFNGSVGGNGSIQGGSFTIGTGTAGSATIYPGGVGTPGTFWIGNSGGQTPVIGSGASFVFDLSSDPANPNANDQVVFGDTSTSATLPTTLNITINELNGILGAGRYLLIDTRDIGGYTAAVSPTFIGTTPTSYSIAWGTSPEGKSTGALYLTVVNPGNPCTTPGTPTIGSTTVGCSQLTVNWSAVSGNGNTYNIWQSPDGINYSLIATAQSGTSYVDATASNPSTTYYYEVAATNVTCGLMGSQSSASTGVSPNATPTVPTMNATTVGCSELTVNWNAATGGSGITYAIARSTGGAYTQIATNQSGASYLDTGANNSGSTYTYEVSAINSSGCLSGYSSASTGVSPAATPSAPTGVSASAGNTTATVTWTTIGGFTYNVYRTAANGSPGSETLYQTAASEPFNDSGLTDGDIYYYKVTAVNGTGCESAQSSEVSATPNPAYSGYTITVLGSGTASTAASAGVLATVTAVNSDSSTASGVNGNIALTFGGLAAAPGGQAPTFTGLTTFSSGVATVTITGYDATNSAAVTATDGTLSTSTGAGAPLTLTVSPAADSAYRISAASTNNAVGAPDALTISLVDQYQNLDSSFNGNKTFNFTGLSAGPDGSLPTVTDKTSTAQQFGSLNTTITFANGVSSVGGSLVAHKAENARLLAATDGTLSTTTPGGFAPTFWPVPGTASQLGINTAPAASAAAGAVLSPQPSIKVLDLYSNLVTSPNTSISVSVSGGNVQGTQPLTTSGGIATFSNLAITNAGTDTLTFSAASITSTNASVTVSAGAMASLSWLVQPGTVVYGSTFSTKPVVVTVDQYGNPSTAGLASSLPLLISLSSGGGTLIGTTSYNIGSGAGNSNGVVSLNDLGVVNGSGSGYQLTASINVGAPVAGATIWMDAANASTLQLNSTNGVIGWTNQGFASGVLICPNATWIPNGNTIAQFGSPNYIFPPILTNNALNGRPVVRFGISGGIGSGDQQPGQGLENRWPNNELNTSTNVTLFYVSRQNVPSGATTAQNPENWSGVVEFANLGAADGKSYDTLGEDAGNSGNGFRFFRLDQTASSPAYSAPGQFAMPFLNNNSLNGQWQNQLQTNGNAYVNEFMFDANATPGSSAAGAGVDDWVDSGGVNWSNYQASTVANTTYGHFDFEDFGLGGQLGSAGSGNSVDEFDWMNDCDIAEVIMYTNRLSDANRAAVKSYLVTKWLTPGSAASPAVSSLFTVQQATITITGGIAANNKLYDGTTNDTLTIGTITFAGVIPQDSGSGITLDTNDIVGYFANPGPGVGIPVTVTGITPAPAGSVATNYVVAPLVLSATIQQPVATFSAFTITDAGSGHATAGAGDPLTISTVDANGNVVSAVDGDISVTFSGLSTAPDGSASTVSDYTGAPQSFGSPTVLYFTNGVASLAGEGVLIAHDAQTASPHISGGTNTDLDAGGSTVSITVVAGPDAAYRITPATAMPAVAVGDALTINLVDQYQNPSSFTGNKTINFGGLSAGPDGSLPTVTDMNGVPQPFGALNTTITFTGGVNTAGGSLVAHKVESNKQLTATGVILSAAGPIGTAPLLSPVAGAAARLGISSEPSATASAGTAFAAQPVVTVLDLYGNAATGSSALIGVGAAVGNVAGTYPTNATAGVATFAGLSLTNAGTNTLTFSSSGLISTNSTVLTTAAGGFAGIGWPTQPAGAVYRTVFGTEPVLAAVDQYGNPTTNGLYASIPVTVALTSGPGALSGTTNYDLGTSGSNGVVSFTDLTIDAVSNNFVLTATASLPASSTPPVTGMAVWLDASAASSVITNSSGVTNWMDLSGNNYNFGVPGGSGTITYGATNMNGKPVVSFSGGPALLTANNAYTFTGNSLTLFCVVRADTYLAASMGPFDSAGATGADGSSTTWGMNAMYPPSANFTVQGTTVMGSGVPDGAAGPEIPFIWEGADNGPANQEWAGYFDGTTSNLVSNPTGAQSAFAITQLAVGSRLGSVNSLSTAWQGDVAEVLLYHSYLSASQQALTYSYLQGKWLGGGGGGPTISAGTAPFTVSPAPLTITGGITANSKAYDDTTNDTLTIGSVTFSGVFVPDNGNVGVNPGAAVGYFANVGPGNGIPVTVTGITTTGTAAGDYVVAPLGLSANITGGPVKETPAFSNLSSPSVTYGTTSVILTGTLSASGPTVYPSMGETVTATINTHAVNGAVTDGTGDFSITYNDPSLASDSVSGGPYPVTYSYAGDASLTSTNDASTQLTVTKATPTVAVASSENPSGFGDSVHFTATVPAAATGTVTFTTNGVNFDVNEAVSSGVATSVSTTQLPRGGNPVTAVYNGDGNYNGNTGTLPTQVVTNHPPVLNPANYSRIGGLELALKFSDLLTNASDADNDTLTLGYVSPSTNGTSLFDDGTYLYYTNSSPPNVSDAFNYYVNDGFGGLTTNTVFLTVDNSQTGQPSLTNYVSGGQSKVDFTAMPNYIYYLQRSTNLTGAGVGWLPLSTNIQSTNGLIQIIDTFGYPAPGDLPAFYRVLVP